MKQFDLDNPGRNWQYYNYRIKQDVPRTWEEYCEQNPVKFEYFIDDYSRVGQLGNKNRRDVNNDANLLKSVKDAEGLLALIKLKRLRDAWWGDWRPDYNEQSGKHYIGAEGQYNTLRIYNTAYYQHFLVFPTTEMASEFRSCFEDLIKQAEMWL